jgi:hypothetical protein
VRKSLFIVATIIIAGVAYSFPEVLTYLKGHTETDAIVLEWQSGNEDGVKSYSVERSDINSSNFQEITTMPATGSNSSYRYRDGAVSSAGNGGTSGGSKVPLADLYKYRLKINYEKEISYSQTISVTRPSSGVKRTWGMIKEMFR